MDIETSASYLAEGGWTSQDEQQLIEEYNISEHQAKAICALIEALEQKPEYPDPYT